MLNPYDMQAFLATQQPCNDDRNAKHKRGEVMEQPILFNSKMVKATLDERKTQTRRVVKLPAGVKHDEISFTRYQDGYPDGIRPVFGVGDEPNAFSVKCPYRSKTLWVRESMYFDADAGWRYAADEAIVTADYHKKTPRPCPSIHMPRKAARLFLKVKRVWVERLQDISADDARAEGIFPFEITEDGRVLTWDAQDGMACFHPRTAFKYLWDSINGKPRTNGVDISWKANPYVWCVEFELARNTK